MSVYRSNVIHQSLHEKKLLAGIDEKIAFPIWIISFVFVLLFGFVYLLPVSLIAHLFMKWLFKNDADLLPVYLSYMRESDTYDPWPRVNSDVKRPEGFGRDFLC